MKDYLEQRAHCTKMKQRKLIFSGNCNWYNISVTVHKNNQTCSKAKGHIFTETTHFVLVYVQFAGGLERLFWFMVMKMTHGNLIISQETRIHLTTTIACLLLLGRANKKKKCSELFCTTNRNKNLEYSILLNVILKVSALKIVYFTNKWSVNTIIESRSFYSSKYFAFHLGKWKINFIIWHQRHSTQ